MMLSCNTCKLSETCPKRGVSPLTVKGNKKVYCQLIGNFGIDPVDESILSPASLVRMKKDGPCTSYVEVPEFDKYSNMLHYSHIVIFHKPILHERQRGIPDIINRIFNRLPP